MLKIGFFIFSIFKEYTYNIKDVERRLDKILTVKTTIVTYGD